MITLIQRGQLFGPEDLGLKDLLIVNDKIECLGSDLSIPNRLFPRAEVINAAGKLISSFHLPF